MATLKDLCSTIPESFKREQAIREVNRRMALSYAQRIGRLAQEERMFDRCVQRRPERGKVKNRFSDEQAGRIGTAVMGVRVGPHTVVVCKSKKRD